MNGSLVQERTESHCRHSRALAVGRRWPRRLPNLQRDRYEGRASDPLVDLTPALNRNYVDGPAAFVHRKDNPPASHAAFPETALVGEQTRKPGIAGRFSELIEAVEDAFPGSAIQPVEILGGPAG